MLYVIRKKDTKEMRCMWSPHPDGLHDIVIDPADDEEFVILPNMNHDTVSEVARAKAKAKGDKKNRMGRVYIHNTTVDAEPPSPEPVVRGVLGELEKMRSNKDNESALTWSDIEKAARTREESEEPKGSRFWPDPQDIVHPNPRIYVGWKKNIGKHWEG